MKLIPSIKMISVINHKRTGEKAREMREETGISLRAVARKMGKSAAFVSDLERGRRNWTPELAELYGWALHHLYRTLRGE